MEVEEDDDKEDEKHLQIKEGWHCRSSPLLHNDDYNDDDDNDGSYYTRSGHLPMRWGAIDAPHTKTTMTTLPRRVSPRRENKDAVSDLPGSAVAPPSKPMVMTPPREKGPRRRRRRTTRDAARLQGFIVISARPTCLNIAGTIVTQHLHPNQQHMHHHPALPRSLSANPESQMTAIKAAMNAPARKSAMDDAEEKSRGTMHVPQFCEEASPSFLFVHLVTFRYGCWQITPCHPRHWPIETRLAIKTTQPKARAPNQACRPSTIHHDVAYIAVLDEEDGLFHDGRGFNLV